MGQVSTADPGALNALTAARRLVCFTCPARKFEIRKFDFFMRTGTSCTRLWWLVAVAVCVPVCAHASITPHTQVYQKFCFRAFRVRSNWFSRIKEDFKQVSIVIILFWNKYFVFIIVAICYLITLLLEC